MIDEVRIGTALAMPAAHGPALGIGASLVSRFGRSRQSGPNFGLTNGDQFQNCTSDPTNGMGCNGYAPATVAGAQKPPHRRCKRLLRGRKRQVHIGSRDNPWRGSSSITGWTPSNHQQRLLIPRSRTNRGAMILTVLNRVWWFAACRPPRLVVAAIRPPQ